jgi:hypothetical protein
MQASCPVLKYVWWSWIIVSHRSCPFMLGSRINGATAEPSMDTFADDGDLPTSPIFLIDDFRASWDGDAPGVIDCFLAPVDATGDPAPISLSWPREPPLLPPEVLITCPDVSNSVAVELRAFGKVMLLQNELAYHRTGEYIKYFITKLVLVRTTVVQ